MNYHKVIFSITLLLILSLTEWSGKGQAQTLCNDSCSLPGPELVMNGDFALQIQNSVYTTSAPFQIPVWAPATLLNFGQYTITNNPVIHNAEWGGSDHTPNGNTYFLVCDGISGSQTSGWGQDVNISTYPPNTNFNFSAWVNNSILTVYNWQDPAMQLRVNGTLLLPSSQILPETPDAWVLIEGTWNSGPAPPPVITIEIVSTSTAPIGNDFAIDDISFRACISAGNGILSVGPDLSICASDSVQLNAISNSGIIQWSPSYGLSATNIFNPVASPDTTTTYIVISGPGTPCEATDTLTIYVSQTQANASFQYTIDSCSNQVTFQNLSGSGFDYLWDFGDGTLANLENPVYTFATSGTYQVSLTVSDSCGSSTIIQPVIIGNALTAQSQFTFSIDSCTSELTFYNQSVNGTNFTWYFGDGTGSSVFNPTHSYLTNGTYNISLVASNLCGSDSSTAQVTIQPAITSVAMFSYTTDSCSNAINFINQSTNGNSYSWDFGDGFNSTDTNPTHAYNLSGLYNVTLTSTGICNSDTQTVAINITQPVSAVAAFTFSSGICGDTVSFINNSTGYSAVLWDFGDGNTSNQINPSHIFNLPGNYLIQLYVSNNCNDSVITFNLTVPDHTITGSAFLASDSCYTVSFQNQLINATNYQWDFGNGNTSFNLSPVYTYPTSGNYNVTLMASNNCSDTTISLQVLISDYTISGSISLLQDSCALLLNYQSQLNNADTFNWSFGDGNNSSADSGIHNYNSTGNYNVTLTATNECAANSFSQNIFMEPSYTPELIPELLLDTCLKQLTFSHTSTNSFDQNWNFGDGSDTQQSSGTHVFASGGTYELVFTVNQFAGCRKDSSFTIFIPESGNNLFIPNIITPNNDDYNDLFPGITTNACTPDHIAIFNRWGNSIFETSGNKVNWDGKSNGNYVPAGVYFYVVRTGNYEYKGTLTVTY